MKSQVIYPTLSSNPIANLRSAILESKCMTQLADLFSLMLEEKVSVQQTLRLINAYVAFSALLLLGGLSPFVAAMLLLWFALAVYQCKYNK